MKKNYLSHILLAYITAFLGMVSATSYSQEPEVFTIKDFDLLGKVKSCEVITDYGKEYFEFNEKGLLIKTITRYNEKDYDITYYKFQGTDLSERRNEVYRDGVFDRNTSIAHVYAVDTIGKKRITEKIISYNEEFLDEYEYLYDIDDRLVKITRSNNEGLDETLVEYTAYKDESTVSHYLNGAIQKSVRTSTKKKKNGETERIELIKEFLEGTPNKATENVYDKEGYLISRQSFAYDLKQKSFSPTKTTTYTYDTRGMLIAQFEKEKETLEEKEFIYQFDNGETGNWVKKIITPENSFITRKIEYYPEEAVEIDE
ncbi:MAG: hypothetical protein AB3N14_19120 [Flavobacteriaceae bacterium]